MRACAGFGADGSGPVSALFVGGEDVGGTRCSACSGGRLNGKALFGIAVDDERHYLIDVVFDFSLCPDFV